uniref:SWIM-type domain-containing protein n=1 Tax=Plectus sambesii TaxID=2011161 RepID=A0A914W8S1_9BILA
MSDGASSITTAIAQVFPDALQLTCWFHMQKQVKVQMPKKGVPKDRRKKVHEDVSALQLAPTLTVFHSAAKKLCNILRQHMLIKSFISLCHRMLTDWSWREVEGREFQTCPPSAKLGTEVRAYHHLQESENESFLCNQIVRGTYIARGSLAGEMRFSRWSRRFTRPNFKSFSEYVVWSRAYYMVDRREDGSLLCSCPVGLKQYVCEHSVAISVAKFRAEFNPLAKSLPLGFKRGRSRPKKVGSALSLV